MSQPIFLKRAEIDAELWDRCILKAKNRRIYAYTWWLDAVTDATWSAIVDDIHTYHKVLPVPVTRKLMAIKRILRPFLTQQLGIFSDMEVDAQTEYALFDLMNKKSHYTDLTIHNGHAINDSQMNKMTNHIIYLKTIKKYNRLTKRNIKDAIDSGFIFSLSDDYEDVVSFMVDHMPYKFSTAEARKCEKLLTSAKALDLLDVWKSFDQKNNTTCIAVCIHDIERVYFILIASTEEGKICCHAYALIDRMILHYKAEGFEVFDFTGSNMENIARRNLGFGAEVEEYLRVKNVDLLKSNIRKN